MKHLPDQPAITLVVEMQYPRWMPVSIKRLERDRQSLAQALASDATLGVFSLRKGESAQSRLLKRYRKRSSGLIHPKANQAT